MAKEHYKLYKAGKLWMTALLPAAVLGVATVAHAATVPTSAAHSSLGQPAPTASTAAPTDLQAKAVPLTGSPAAGQAKAQATAHPLAQPAAPQGAKQGTQQAGTSQATGTAQDNSGAAQTMAKADSTVTVTNPVNYPTRAAQLIGHNNQDQPYYIFQIVKMNNKQISNQQAVMICAVDPGHPQGTVYVFVTTEQYRRVYQAIVVMSGKSARISVDQNGKPLLNPSANQVYLVSNTAPQTMRFNGQLIHVPASLAIKSSSQLTVSPLYGLGNQQNIKYTNKVDITPDNTSSSIEYLYRDPAGNYVHNPDFPANVPVKGLTGQQFTVTNINKYKQVLNGYYLTNQRGSLANTANGRDYTGTISQFQIGKYYQKTLYNNDGSIYQQLIYHLLDPQGTMDITMLEPGKQPETLRVPAGTYKVFQNGTLARNPFVSGAHAVQLIYADLGRIIPVDENGKVIPGAPQPIYQNDQQDPHKAATTLSPDLTSQGWYIQDASQQTITPVNPGADTKVVYLKEITDVKTVKVSQTVHYQYEDGITSGRPTLPADNVQTVSFTHTVKINPVTGAIISDSWTPAQQFTAVATPTINGFFPDLLTAGGNDHVTPDTPDSRIVVNYRTPNTHTIGQTITQTIEYRYWDGVTAGRPALPADNVQQVHFTGTVTTHPDTGETIKTVWTADGADHFTVVATPALQGDYMASDSQAGSAEQLSYDSSDTHYIVYYAAPTVETTIKPVTRTVYYVYDDGNTTGRPALPATNVQTVNFTSTKKFNPFTGTLISQNWQPSAGHFNDVVSPEVKGFYPDQRQIAGNQVTPASSDDDFVVRYAAPTTKITEIKPVYQRIRYEYADGLTAGRPTLPATDTQKLVFQRTVDRNPWTGEVVADTWSGSQQFTVVTTPTIPGYYPNLTAAGSDAAITHDSDDLNFVVQYAPAKVETSQQTVHQTIRYEYADGITAGRPALPADNQQELTFTRTVTKNPWTGAVITDVWSPAQRFATVVSPTMAGFTPDQDAIDGREVDHLSSDQTFIVKYVAQRTPDQPGGPSEKPTQPGQPGLSSVTGSHGNQPGENNQHQPAQRLPQTGSRGSATASLGLAMLGLTGLLGIHRKHE